MVAATKKTVTKSATRPKAGIVDSSTGAMHQFINSWAGKAIGSMLGVLFTFVVVDVLVKRNVENFLAEKSRVQKAASDAWSEYSRHIDDINSLVRRRRLASQQLNGYAADFDLLRYRAYYEKYQSIIEEWNDMKVVLENRTRRFFPCDTGMEDMPEEARQRLVSATTRMTGADSGSIDARYSHCPEKVLFTSRARDIVSREGVFRSVDEVFQFLHSGLALNIDQPVFSCVEESEETRRLRLSECARMADPDDYSTCIRQNVTRFSTRNVCDAATYGKLTAFSAGRFDSVDRLWFLGVEALKARRETYSIQKCESAKGFWGNTFLFPSCRELLAGLKLI